MTTTMSARAQPADKRAATMAAPRSCRVMVFMVIPSSGSKQEVSAEAEHVDLLARRGHGHLEGTRVAGVVAVDLRLQRHVPYDVVAQDQALALLVGCRDQRTVRPGRHVAHHRRVLADAPAHGD